MNEETSEDYYSGSDKEDTSLYLYKNKTQLQGKIILRTDELFLTRVQMLSKNLKESKKEVIAARKIQLQLSLGELSVQSTKVRFHNDKSSNIKAEILKKIETELCRNTRTL